MVGGEKKKSCDIHCEKKKEEGEEARKKKEEKKHTHPGVGCYFDRVP